MYGRLGKLTFTVIVFLLSAYGGGGSITSNNNKIPTSSVIIGGQADKGPVAKGTVTAYAITSSGTKDSVLSAVTTNANGNYYLTVSSYTGPVFLEITGGTYIDKATGAAVSLPTTAGSGLQAVLTNVTAGSPISAQITALTSMTAAQAQAMAGGLTPSNITAANQNAGSYFGGIDIINTQLINPLTANSATGSGTQVT